MVCANKSAKLPDSGVALDRQGSRGRGGNRGRVSAQLSSMADLVHCTSFFWLLMLVLVLCSPSQAATTSNCKCLPSDACWPDARIWSEFNASVDGQLLASKPPAWPCYKPNLDKAQCSVVTSKWSDPFWRAAQAGAMQDSFFEMDGHSRCLLNASDSSATCSQGRVPVFAVRVSKPEHVQKAVRFASAHKLRLVIKNTGHDYLGRSSGAGSLSLWMHNLQSIQFVNKFVPQGCPSSKARAGVVTGAGVVWEDLYKAVHEQGRTIAGAQCTSVGASGGYPQAAGHSPMSPTYGFSADNVLEYQVVTASGELLAANACQNKDLFWALRGGGGGTFAVVLSTTHATHPPLKSLVMASHLVTAKDTSGLQSVLTDLIKLTPSLSDAGWGGFMVVSPSSLFIQYLLPNGNMSAAETSFKPLLASATKTSSISITPQMQLFSSYYDWHRAIQCSSTGCSYPTGESQLLTSRLIPRSTFSSNSSELAAALLKIKSQGYDRLLVYLTTGGKAAVRQDNAVNPAWRSALWHVIVAKLFDGKQSLVETTNMKVQITQSGQLLRDLTPGSGSYLNEADYNEPNWQRSFFGSNYPKLKAIKKKVDPDGLFVCRHCVGSEDWDEQLKCRTA